MVSRMERHYPSEFEITDGQENMITEDNTTSDD